MRQAVCSCLKLNLYTSPSCTCTLMLDLPTIFDKCPPGLSIYRPMTPAQTGTRSRLQRLGDLTNGLHVVDSKAPFSSSTRP